MSRIVMIIEDEPKCVREVTRLVEGWGFEALHVSSADEAIRAADDERICLVLLDPMTDSAEHASLVYEGRGTPIVMIPVALRVAPPDWRVERFLVAPESLERIVRHHCSKRTPIEVPS
jgi:DNA-binding NtrC family response regulator